MPLSWKRFGLAIAAVFVAQAAVSGILYATVVENLAKAPAFFRAEGHEHVVFYIFSRVIFVAVFTYLYTRFTGIYNLRKGLIYGLLIWLFYSVPMTVGLWAFVKIPDMMAVSWIIVGFGEMLAGGAVLGLVIKRKSLVEKSAPA